MDGASWVLAAAVCLVGSHLLLSHALRAPLIEALGERLFFASYSLISLAALLWLIAAYRAAPVTAPLWPVGTAIWIVVTFVMLCAAILFNGSLLGNPALPKRTGAVMAPPASARGVYAITRHPMMWALALWGLCHIAIFPVAKNIIVAASIVCLALLGAALQDRKKRRQMPGFWPSWEEKTSFVPFVAIMSGRARFGGFRPHDYVGGLVIWLAATWAHLPLAGVAAGLWRWI